MNVDICCKWICSFWSQLLLAKTERKRKEKRKGGWRKRIQSLYLETFCGRFVALLAAVTGLEQSASPLSRQQWRAGGGGAGLGAGQFTVWPCPLSSGWSVAARGPTWSRRSPASVVAPAHSSPRSPWPAWPPAPLFCVTVDVGRQRQGEKKKSYFHVRIQRNIQNQICPVQNTEKCSKKINKSHFGPCVMVSMLLSICPLLVLCFTVGCDGFLVNRIYYHIWISLSSYHVIDVITLL